MFETYKSCILSIYHCLMVNLLIIWLSWLLDSFMFGWAKKKKDIPKLNAPNFLCIKFLFNDKEKTMIL